MDILKRKDLQELREKAMGMSIGNLNPDWKRAYESLAEAADRLDAMQARNEVPPDGGWCVDTPEVLNM